MNSKDMPSETKPAQDINQDDIAAEAYRLYVEGGRQEGRDLEYWLEAEKSLSAKSNRDTERKSPRQFAKQIEGDGEPEGRSLPDAPIRKNRRNTLNRQEIRQLNTDIKLPPRQSQRPNKHSA